LEWGIGNNAELIGTCEIVVKTFTAEELPLDADGKAVTVVKIS
jgi:hypothetical protein